MKKFLAQFFIFSAFLLLTTFSFTAKAHAAVRVEIEPSTVTYGGTIKLTAFGCNSGKVDFYWQTAAQQAAKSNSYTKQPGINTSPSTENPATIVAVYELKTDTTAPGDWYLHAYCKANNENSPDTKFTVTDKKAPETVSIPSSIDGYTQIEIDYSGFQLAQCYYILVIPQTGSLKTELPNFGIFGGDDLPNYNNCTSVIGNNTYFSSSQLPAIGKLLIHPLPPGTYAVKVGRPTTNSQVQTISEKVITVNESKNGPQIKIQPNVFKTNTDAFIYVKGCPANSNGFIKWSDKDAAFNTKLGQKAVSFDAKGDLVTTFIDETGRYVKQSYATQNSNQIWVECGQVRSAYDFFTVTDSTEKLPQVFIELPDKTVKTYGDTIAFPVNAGVSIWATGCPTGEGNSTKANFKWKHATTSDKTFVQAGNKDNVNINSSGVTDRFAVPFKDANYNQIQVTCSDKSSLPLFFTVGDPEGLATDNKAVPTPTPTPKPVYAPCLEGINAAGKKVQVIKPGESPDQTTIETRLKDIVTCTKVGSGIGSISTDPAGFIKYLFQLILSISGGIALLVLIRAGYKYMTSQGNAEALKSAQEEITSAVVGLLFLLFSMVLLQVIGVDILQLPGFSSSKTSLSAPTNGQGQTQGKY